MGNESLNPGRPPSNRWTRPANSIMMRPLMRWLFLCVTLAACDTSSTLDLDFGLVQPGCRAPSQCWRTTGCACTFASVNDPDAPSSCLVCDPKNETDGVCTCEG